MKSSKDVKASIQWVATYERQSLHNKLTNATPWPLVCPATPWNSTKSCEVSDNEDGGDMMDNVSYKPPSESTLGVPITDCDLGFLPDPVKIQLMGQTENMP